MSNSDSDSVVVVRKTDKWWYRMLPVVGYLLLAGGLMLSLGLQRQALEKAKQVQLHATCAVLDHKVGSRVGSHAAVLAAKQSGRILLNLVQDSNARKPASERLPVGEVRRRINRVQVPELPESTLIDARDVACEEAGSLLPREGVNGVPSR